MLKSALKGIISKFINPWLQYLFLKYPKWYALCVCFQKSKLAQYMVYLRPFFRGLRRIAMLVGLGGMGLALLSLAFIPEAQTFVVFEPSSPTGASVEKVVQDLPFTAVGVLPNISAQLAFLLFLIYLIFFALSRLFSAVLNGLFSVYLFQVEVLSVCHGAQNKYLCWDFGGIKLLRYLDLSDQYRLFSKVYPNFSLEYFQQMIYPETASIHNIRTLQVEGANRMASSLDKSGATEPQGWAEGFSQPIFGMSTQTGLSPEMVFVFLGIGVVTLGYLVFRFFGSDEGGFEGPGSGPAEEELPPVEDGPPDTGPMPRPEGTELPYWDIEDPSFHSAETQAEVQNWLTNATDDDIRAFLAQYENGTIGYLRQCVYLTFSETPLEPGQVRIGAGQIGWHLIMQAISIRGQMQHHPPESINELRAAFLRVREDAAGFHEVGAELDDFSYMRLHGARAMDLIYHQVDGIQRVAESEYVPEAPPIIEYAGEVDELID